MRTTNLKTVAVISLFLLGIVSTATGEVIYVDANAPPGGNGETWETAYKYLQDALARAVAGDEIWVAEGIYKPDQNSAHPDGSGNRYVPFPLKNGVAVYGGFQGVTPPPPGLPEGETSRDQRDWQTNKTILSGDLNGNDGDVNDPRDLLNAPNRAENSYHVVTGSGTGERTVLDGFTITGGYANRRTYPNDHGAGMFNESGSPEVTNCVFIANAAYASIGSGAGMFNGFSSSPKVISCIFRLNACFFNGGGMANDNSSRPELTNCLFNTNYAGNDGGGVANYKFCRPKITNCTFRGNEARRCGGGISNYEACKPNLANCIFWGNIARIDPQIQDLAGSHTTVKYSDIQGGWPWPGDGNIDDDPLFVDTANGDYHLLPDSPCIDAGDNNSVPADIYDLDGDGNTTEPLPWDLDGNPRIIDGNFDCNRVVDMGAYEFFPAIEVAMKFTPQALNPRSKGNWVKAHFIMPDGFVVEDVDANKPAWIEPLGIESEYINVFINEDGFVEIEAVFSRVEFCAAGQIDGTIRVIGVLTSDQYFYGTDTIRIISNNLK